MLWHVLPALPEELPPIWWFAPYFDGSSFGKEATTAILGLIRCDQSIPF